jgi:hypothetical protein
LAIFEVFEILAIESGFCGEYLTALSKERRTAQ